MSYLGLDPRQEADLLERATFSPQEFALGNAGAFEGLVGAPARGVASAAVDAARFVNLGLSAIPRAVDTVRGGTEAEDWWHDRMTGPKSSLARYSHELSPDPLTVGAVGRVVQSLFEVVPLALATGPAGAGTIMGTTKALDLMDKGVDAETATRAGVVEGASLGIGVGLPMSIGMGTLRNALYGAGAAALPNMAARGLTNQILAKAGYKDMAEQYRMLDAEAIATDLILGAAFGHLGTKLEARKAREVREAMSTADVDAALTANNARHLEMSGPGIPADFATREAHVAAITKATEDLMAGRPVNVEEALGTEAAFVPDPRRANVKKQFASVAKQYEPIAERVRQREFELEGVDPAFSGQAQELLRSIDQEVTPYNVRKVERIARASELDGRAYDAIPDNFEDPALVDRLHAIIEPHEQAAAQPARAGEVEAALKSEGLDATPDNMATVELIGRARQIDAAAVDAIPAGLSDAEYLGRVTAIADQPAQAGGRGHADERAATDMVKQAVHVAATRPDIMVQMHDGESMSVHEAMVHSDQILETAQREGAAIDAAIECFLQG